ncbi:MAG: hypothetical protein QM775_11900 [Pirellulales bacterium]
MKRIVLAALALCVIAGAEVARADYVQTCQQCQTGGRKHHHGHMHGHRQAQACPPQGACAPQGPFSSLLNCLGLGGRNDSMYGYSAPAPTVGYPYYTVRAPRDFLDPNPRSIGP